MILDESAKSLSDILQLPSFPFVESLGAMYLDGRAKITEEGWMGGWVDGWVGQDSFLSRCRNHNGFCRSKINKETNKLSLLKH